MNWFKKKHIYYIAWSYLPNDKAGYTEFVKATDVCQAWNKIRRAHTYSIYAVAIKRIE